MNVDACNFTPIGDFSWMHHAGCECQKCRPSFNYMEAFLDRSLHNKVDRLEKVIIGLQEEIVKLVDRMSKKTERKDTAKTPKVKNVKLDKVKPKDTKVNANDKKRK